MRNIKPSDFDRSIKQGRDEMYFLKREAIERLSSTTRFSEPELQNLKSVYVSFAVPKQGLNFDNFANFMALMINVENHPFMPDIFVWFDKDEDGLVDFDELIRGLDIMERGTFAEKVSYAFDLYDTYNLQLLDIATLR